MITLTVQDKTSQSHCFLYIIAYKYSLSKLKSLHPFWPYCSTLRLGPYRFRIHLLACCWGSTIRGQRWLVIRMAAFSTDSRSAGRPWFCQPAMVSWSVSISTGSRPSVSGIGVWIAKCEERKTDSDAIQFNAPLECRHSSTVTGFYSRQLRKKQWSKTLLTLTSETRVGKSRNMKFNFKFLLNKTFMWLRIT